MDGKICHVSEHPNARVRMPYRDDPCSMYSMAKWYGHNVYAAKRMYTGKMYFTWEVIYIHMVFIGRL